jgi:hypothetical protein
MTPVPSLTERQLLSMMRTLLSPSFQQQVQSDNHGDVLVLCIYLAALYIERGETQEAADILAWVLLQAEDFDASIIDMAQEHFETLEASICPRVIHDARDFASKATLQDILDYIYADSDLSPPYMTNRNV